jgi:DHA2 family multidrug resistance protein
MASATADVTAARKRAPTRHQDVTEHGWRLVLIIIGVMAASLMQTLDSTITNVALPTIQGNLGATQEEATWVITAYTIAAVVVIPLTPWLQDRFGRKNYFVASIVGFTIASAACGASEDLTFLIVSRAVQGAFGGGLLATAQSILRDCFPPRLLGLSQGIFALGAIVGPALGPTLGGLIVDNATWNWVFDINIVPGTVASVLLFMLLRDPEGAQTHAIDLVGLGLLCAGLASMQYVLTEGELHYWFSDPVILAMTFVCALSLAAFVFYELFGTDHPIVDLRILKNRSVAAGCGLGIALGGAVFGSSYVLPQFTQGPLGFTPTLSGELFLLRAVPTALCVPLIVRFAPKIDTRWVLGIGFALVALGSYLQALVTTPQAGFWTFAPALILSGVGAAMLFIPLSIAVLGATTPREGPKAAAFVNLSLQLGGSILVAALGVLLDRTWTQHSVDLDAHARLSNPVIQMFLQRGGNIQELAGIIDLQSAIIAYADVTFAIAVMCAVSIPLVFLMRKPKAPAGPVEMGG